MTSKCLSSIEIWKSWNCRHNRVQFSKWSQIRDAQGGLPDLRYSLEIFSSFSHSTLRSFCRQGIATERAFVGMHSTIGIGQQESRWEGVLTFYLAN